MERSFDRNDPRALRSRTAILETARALADASPSGFTVSEIIHAAAISRSTFYAHFRDADDVYFALLDDRLDAISQSDLEARQRGDDPAQILLTGHARVMRHLAEHREFFAAVLASPERAKVRERFTRRLAELLVRSMDAAPSHPDPVELQVAAVYTAAGFTAAASDWLAGAFDLDEAELTRIVVAMSPEWLRNPEVRAP